MTSGGTVARVISTRAKTEDRVAGRSLLMRPRVIESVPTVIAVVVFFGCFLRVRQRWFIPGMSGFGYDTWVVQSTMDGVAIAPNQYRPLMPWMDHLISIGFQVPLPTAILLADFGLLGLTVWLLARLCRRLGAPEMILLAAAVWAFWVAKLDHWHPEVMLLTAAVTGAAVLLVEHRSPNLALLALGTILCGARTDYALGFGLIVIAVGISRRRVELCCSGSAIVLAAIIATIMLAAVFYPQARYQVGVVQLPFNLTPGVLAMVVTFYGAVLLVPLLYVLQRRGLPPLSFVIAWFAVELAATFVVGRVEETRIFMPFAPVLAVAAGAAWRRLRWDGDLAHLADAPPARSASPFGP